jgi:DNA polymerase III subunit alpha
MERLGSLCSYAFNKSHSVCYAYIAYQTGFLKAHYPGEFMAANLSRNLNNITDITKLMNECSRMKPECAGTRCK